MEKKIRTEIKVTTIIEIYHQFKNNPKKIFLTRDFDRMSWTSATTCLFILTKLGVIEELPTIYQYGKRYRIRRECKGYRLKQEGKNGDLER